MNTHIYFARHRETGHIKIGISKNPEQRMTGISGACLLGSSPGTATDEKLLHYRFRDSLVQGNGREWFLPTVEVLRCAADVGACIAETRAMPAPPDEWMKFGRVPISGLGQTRILRNYKLPPSVITKIKALADATGLSNAEVIVRAIDRAAAEQLKAATSGREDE